MRFASTLMIAVALLGASARADATDEKVVQEARARFVEGMQRARSKDYEGARLSFVEAYAVLKQRDVLFNLAFSEMMTKHPLEALAHFRAYDDDASLTEASHAEARKYIAQLEHVTSRIHAKLSDGARVTIDGTAVSSSASIDVSAGTHALVAIYAGDRREASVECRAGEDVTVDLQLPARAADDHHGNGGPPVTISERPLAGIILPLALVVVGGTGIAVGIGEGLDTQSKRNDANALANACATPTSAQCTQLRSLRDTMSTNASISVAGYVAGGVLAAAGVVSFLLWPRTTVHVAPAVTTSFVGGFVGVSF